MAQKKHSVWLLVFFALILASFIISGAIGLYRDWTSIGAYLMLGLGLGGCIAAGGEWLQSRKEKQSAAHDKKP